ncbi:uncharacterized protein LOC135692970 [Rhopilema esculentum]|uniref:uncharacterized protein LOC135692970 n=1 Tax=Rhopilema esculentum TaxID=499914 RepID=UPI0031E3FCFC
MASIHKLPIYVIIGFWIVFYSYGQSEMLEKVNRTGEHKSPYKTLAKPSTVQANGALDFQTSKKHKNMHPVRMNTKSHSQRLSTTATRIRSSKSSRKDSLVLVSQLKTNVTTKEYIRVPIVAESEQSPVNKFLSLSWKIKSTTLSNISSFPPVLKDSTLKISGYPNEINADNHVTSKIYPLLQNGKQLSNGLSSKPRYTCDNGTCILISRLNTSKTKTRFEQKYINHPHEFGTKKLSFSYLEKTGTKKHHSKLKRDVKSKHGKNDKDFGKKISALLKDLKSLMESSQDKKVLKMLQREVLKETHFDGKKKHRKVRKFGNKRRHKPKRIHAEKRWKNSLNRKKSDLKKLARYLAAQNIVRSGWPFLHYERNLTELYILLRKLRLRGMHSSDVTSLLKPTQLHTELNKSVLLPELPLHTMYGSSLRQTEVSGGKTGSEKTIKTILKPSFAIVSRNVTKTPSLNGRTILSSMHPDHSSILVGRNIAQNQRALNEDRSGLISARNKSAPGSLYFDTTKDGIHSTSIRQYLSLFRSQSITSLVSMTTQFLDDRQLPTIRTSIKTPNAASASIRNLLSSSATRVVDSLNDKLISDLLDAYNIALKNRVAHGQESTERKLDEHSTQNDRTSSVVYSTDITRYVTSTQFHNDSSTYITTLQATQSRFAYGANLSLIMDKDQPELDQPLLSNSLDVQNASQLSDEDKELYLLQNLDNIVNGNLSISFPFSQKNPPVDEENNIPYFEKNETGGNNRDLWDSNIDRVENRSRDIKDSLLVYPASTAATNDASTARSDYVTEKTQQLFSEEPTIKQSKELAIKDVPKATMKLERDLNLNAEGKNFLVTLEILGEKFDESLLSVESRRFQNLRESFQNSLLKLYSNDDSYVSTRIHGFRRGPTIGAFYVDVVMKFSTISQSHLLLLAEKLKSRAFGNVAVGESIIKIVRLNDDLKEITWCKPPCYRPYKCFPQCSRDCCVKPVLSIINGQSQPRYKASFKNTGMGSMNQLPNQPLLSYRNAGLIPCWPGCSTMCYPQCTFLCCMTFRG